MRYTFRRGVPAIHAEIYLPKKSGFQGPLYSALTDGRKPEVVHAHFRQHRARIAEILRKEWPGLAGRLDDGFIDALAAGIQGVFIGYSMYEVDGVYFPAGETTPVEERTQVVRLMFEFPVRDDDSADVVAEVKRYLRSEKNALADYTPTRDEFRPRLLDVERWVEQVGAFLFGFVLHRIELAIDADASLRQKEIWLASVWNAVINKFVPEG